MILRVGGGGVEGEWMECVCGRGEGGGGDLVATDLNGPQMRLHVPAPGTDGRRGGRRRKEEEEATWTNE